MYVFFQSRARPQVPTSCFVIPQNNILVNFIHHYEHNMPWIYLQIDKLLGVQFVSCYGTFDVLKVVDHISQISAVWGVIEIRGCVKVCEFV